MSHAIFFLLTPYGTTAFIRLVMKYLLIGILSFYTSLLCAQVNQFRAFKSTMTLITSKDHTGDKLNWVDDKALIVQDLKTRTLRVYANKKATFSWVNATVKDPQKLDNNTKATLIYDTIDKDGEECSVQFDFFKPNTVGFDGLIYFKYRNYILSYMINVVH